MLVTLSQFKGLVPKLAPDVLPQQAAQTAKNCLFGSGALRPLKSELAVTTNALAAGTKLSIFRYATNKWLSWITDVDICRTSIPMDANDRIYWTGDGVPKMGTNSTILGPGVMPANSYTLGIPKPAGTPVVSGAAAAGNSLTAETRAYVYTFVSAYGEEGPPSNPSNIISVEPGTAVTVSSMSIGAANIIYKNIYRINQGTTSAEYQYVGSVLMGVPTYGDSIADENLGEVLLSSTWTAPEATMKGLISHPAGFLVGFYGNTVCFSEPYLPHAWDALNEVTLESAVVAIGAYGTSIIVATKGLPYVITGSAPGQMSVEKLEKGEACTLKRSLVDMGYACIFAGTSGLWMAGTGTVELITAQLMTSKEWQTYAATMQFAVQFENLYIGFMTTGGFIFDTSTGDFSTHDITATAGWYDRENGKLYLVVSGAIVEWAGGATSHTLIWKSKKMLLPYPMNFGAAQVITTAACTAKVYADGVLKHTQSVTDSYPFRLPSGFRATSWEIQVEGTSDVTSVSLASSMSELAQV